MKHVPSRRAGAALLVTAVAGASVAAGVASAATSLNIKSKRQGVEFTKKRLSAEPGRVTITLKVPRRTQFPHAIAVKGNGIDREGAIAQGGDTSRVRVNLRAGNYTFYCPVGEHEENGMKGRLRVR
jgi:plastocyanin